MTESTNETRVHKAGIFDIRFIIAALLGIYGLITLVTGLFASDSQIDKSDGVNINLVAGIGMLVASAAFAAWARLRPIVVPADPEQPAEPDLPEQPGPDSGDRPVGH